MKTVQPDSSTPIISCWVSGFVLGQCTRGLYCCGILLKTISFLMMAKKKLYPHIHIGAFIPGRFSGVSALSPLGQEAQRIMSKVRPATTRTFRNCSSTKSNILVQIAQRAGGAGIQIRILIPGSRLPSLGRPALLPAWAASSQPAMVAAAKIFIPIQLTPAQSCRSSRTIFTI